MGMTKKQIAFDIDTNIAKQILGNNYTRVYEDIRRFLQDDFQHIQGSVYVSKKPMTNLSVYFYMKDLLQHHPYMEKCVRDISLSSVANTNTLNQLFSYDGTAGKYKKFDLPLPEKKPIEANLLKRAVTLEEATAILNHKIPFNAKRIDDKVYIIFEKSRKAQIDEVLKSLNQKKSAKLKR